MVSEKELLRKIKELEIKAALLEKKRKKKERIKQLKKRIRQLKYAGFTSFLSGARRKVEKARPYISTYQKQLSEVFK